MKKRSLSYQPQVNDMLLSLDSSPSPHLPISSFGPGGNAIAQAASQAIAATQQLTGRRTSSLKASFEAVNLGMQSHEFSIGRDYAGAASMAAAAAASSSSSQVVYMSSSFWQLAFESLANIFLILLGFFVNNVVCQSNHFCKAYNKAKCYEKSQIFNL